MAYVQLHLSIIESAWSETLTATSAAAAYSATISGALAYERGRHQAMLAAAAAAAAEMWAGLLSSGLDASAPVLWLAEGFIGAAQHAVCGVCAGWLSLLNNSLVLLVYYL
jgi:hypothetical protein